MNLKELMEKVSKDFTSLDAFLDAHRTYGLSAVYIKDMTINETLSIGIKSSITPNTMFQGASISKSIFAATIMRLYEIGVIDIDQDISSYVASMIDPTYDGSPHQVTFRNLLTHTAGFNIHGFAGYLHTQKLPTVEDILTGKRPSNSLQVKMIKAPNKEFMYSGGGFMLAQYILEMMTQKSYQQWVDELVFVPLGMAHSTVSMPIIQSFEQNIAHGWSAYDTPLDHGYIIYPELAAAGLWTTPSDLARFGIEIMCAIQNKSNWLSEKSAKMMITTPLNIKSEYGIGFQIKTVKEGVLFGHGGDNTGYHSRMAFNPHTNEGIIVMVNSDIGDNVPNQILELFIKSYL